MISYLHNIIFAIFPAVVPTPKCKIRPAPTDQEIIDERIQLAKLRLASLHLAAVDAEVALFACQKEIVRLQELLLSQAKGD